MEVEEHEIEHVEGNPQRPKKKLSPEHLAKMMEGKKRYLEAKKKAKTQKKSIILEDSEEEVDEAPPIPRKPIQKKKPKIN